ncbi:MOSC domain protein [Teladorsagia circumcincta]|uniref:MOSC domain protein n=1 Tax=Teladorsagia circumcincta TaxID=45464 RepID=A0A2G9TWF8_TELCI|nr:MOSC domain protein [Teladorsagia circumcincta]
MNVSGEEIPSLKLVSKRWMNLIRHIVRLLRTISKNRSIEAVSSKNFRAVIVVDHCAAWDEDKWDDLKIGETRLQCFRPCTRCVLTTVDPTTGIKDIDMQPLKELRQFRLAPDGPMREQLKDSPIFGVNVGVNKPGYIHVGQTVYARYKKSAF